jgi:NADPH:quinone reductase-like Zn-dependent oxidoreductase
VQTPSPKNGEALIQLNATSVNPSDLDEIKLGACKNGCGADLSGVVVACPGCTRLKVGDKVWAQASHAFADFAVHPESKTGLRPTTLGDVAAGVVPEDGLTSLFSLKRLTSDPGSPLVAGSPWANKTNVTVVITSGSGGTGSFGIALAKAYGATNIWTATTGDKGTAFVKGLGATLVVDYKKQDIFDALADNSVDFVYDNYGAAGTADKAMRAIRSGGTYLLMPHGACFVDNSQKPPCVAANPKPGVRQLNFATAGDFSKNSLIGLDEIKELFDTGKMHPVKPSFPVGATFQLSEAASAFNYSAGSGGGGVNDHIGKIAIEC